MRKFRAQIARLMVCFRELRRLAMLTEFRVENHRSLRDEQVLTLEVGRIGNEPDARVRQIEGSPNLLPVAVLYGANASGKSNVLAALSFMRDAVLESHRAWSPDEGVPRDPFAWGPSKEEPSLFEVSMIIDGVRYRYGFTASDECFEEEWLYAWPHGKKQLWFSRERGSFKFGESLRGENKLIEDVTRNNALFLSAAVQLKHQQLLPIFAWYRQIQTFNVARGQTRRRGFFGRPPTEFILARMLEDDSRQATLFEEEGDSNTLARRFRSLIRSADIGIVDVRLIKSETEDPRYPRSRFQLRHQGEYEDAWLPLEEESQGTRTLFRMAVPILQAIQSGGVLLVDELEASLHPSLAQQIVRQFNDPSANPRNAQLIFATHDTNLLGSTLGDPALRRDQVWLTEKDDDGATVLYPLTDYKPRKAENVERGYLQGRYGAIPFLSDFSLAADE
jgi:uncharacterized protein